MSDPPRAHVVAELRDLAGKLTAVKIRSELLDDHLYVSINPEFSAPEALATYSPAEIEAMKSKSPEQVVEIHKVKTVFSGARVVQ